VEELIVETHVGMYSHEYGKPQKIVIDAVLQYEQPPVEADSAGLIDYDGWCSVIEAYLSTKAHTRLLETLAADIARLSFQRWPSVASITLSLHKPKIRTNARRLGIALQLRREDIVEDD
jgi:dihydroneopterin aldolase